MFKEYGKDLPFYVFSKAAAVLSWIAIVWILTHKLEPEQYGEYALLFSILSLMTIVTTSWLNSSIYRHLPEFAANSDVLRFQAIVIRLTSVTILLGLVAFGTVLLSMAGAGVLVAPPEALVGVTVAFAGNCAFTLAVAYLSAKRSLRLYATATVGQVSLFALGIWLGLDHVENKIALIFAVLTGSYLPTLVVTLRRGSYNREPVWQKALEYLRYGLPLMLMSAATLINMYGDQFLIRVFYSSAEVGLYSANYLFAERSVISVSSIMMVAYLPILFRLWEDGNRIQAYAFISKIVILMLVILIPIAGLLFMFGKNIAGVFIDSSFSAANGIIPIVGFAAIVSAVAGVIADVMSLHKKTLSVAGCYGLGAATNIALNIFAIPRFGYQSAAVTTLVSSFVVLLAVCAGAYRYGKAGTAKTGLSNAA